MFTVSRLIPDLATARLVLEAIDLPYGQSVLVQIFSSFSPDQVLELAGQIRNKFPQACLLGCSTEEVIFQGEIHRQTTLLQITVFEQAYLSRAVVTYSDDYVEDGKRLARRLELHEATKAVVCFSEQMDTLQVPRFALQTLQGVEVPVAGGAAKQTPAGRWVLLDDTCYQDASVAVALHGEALHVETGGYTEWQPVGRAYRVTVVDGNRVISLDDEPIEAIYERNLGLQPDMPREWLISFPLLKGEYRQQDIFLPLSQDPQGGICFDRPLTVQDEVRFCFNHPSLTLEQVHFTAKQLQAKQCQQVWVFNCALRLNFMHENHELRPLQAVAPTDGCYCWGELLHHKGQQQVMHHSMTFLALREGELRDIELAPLPIYPQVVTSPLFNLIRHAFHDLDVMTDNLAQQIRAQTSLLTASYRRDRRTGLPNRVVLRERLQTFAENEHLIVIKVTNFNQINEKYGYPVGDKLLCDLSEQFQRYLDQKLEGCSVLYAIGVGEWATVFHSRVDGKGIHSHFYQFVEQLEHVNFEPWGLPNVDYLSISLCAGLVSQSDFTEHTPDDLLLRAIEARRNAFSNNRHFCNASRLKTQETVRQERLNWLSRVSRAVLRDDVVVYAQPICQARNHIVASYECLVRIEDEGEIILPGHFLPIITDTHLYTRLSRQMITHTFNMMRHRPEAFSINLSPQDLMSERTLLHLEAAIKSMADPSRVGLEVLESEQIKDYGRMIEVCNHFRSLGATIIVDDFGSGYSNIDEIVKLEPQVIKLDGSLIRNIDQDAKQRRIAEQLVKLCQVLNAKTVAEFVHNQTVCRISEDMGVDYLQGYFLGRPTRLG
ncbi:sensory box/GGDEF family protein [Vibrio sp. RC586]|uniref:bifunctional diguanylate cyclase/phosphodiesterase n=1 Tax=Vibrio sp. RC586 TaxID=675815 RepID=UPI0001BB7E1D|nr:EAL domain-containing protein [Vibrio sp. RC586]EEY98090.1 sensory box/GGDEF family protein [Vibrio sp. RC586]